MSAGERRGAAPGESLTLEFELPHPPEKVWRALTEPQLLAEWLLPVTGFGLEPGTAFTYRTDPHPGWNGVVNCRMLEVEPGRKLSCTWGVPFLETIVTFSVDPTPSGSRLTIVQSGFRPEQRREFGGARYGWTMMGGKLAELLVRVS